MKNPNIVFIPFVDLGVDQGGKQLAPIWRNKPREDEEEYINKKYLLELLGEEKEIDDCPTQFEIGWHDGRVALRNFLIEKIGDK